MISTNDSELSNLVAMLRKHGGSDKYNVDYIGYNSRLDTLQAAILLVKLKHVDRLNDFRRQIAKTYNNRLQGLSSLEVPLNDEPGHVYHQYTLRVKNGLRDHLQQQLKQSKIASAVYYPIPLHKMKVYQNRCRIHGDLTFSEKASLEVLSLPIEPLLTDKEIELIIDAVKTALK